MRFGLLGTGYWANEVHAAALAAHPDVEFAAVWGRDPAKASALAERYGATAYQDLDELFGSVDAVAVALPPDVQAGLALRAAQAGKHLLLDKPLALTTEAADAIVAEVHKRQLASVIFFTSHFQPATVAALEAAKQIGDWNGARATMFGSIYIDGSPYRDSTWRHVHGGLWDLGPHALSLLIPILGPVTELSAMAGPRQTTYVTLMHDSGAVSTMELTLNVAEKATRFQTVFHGEHGWHELPGFDGKATESMTRAISALLSTVGGPEHPLGVRFGRDVVAVLEAAQQSTVDALR